VKHEGRVGKSVGSIGRGAELTDEDLAVWIMQGYRQVYSKGRCSTCVNCQHTCWINLKAIEAWKEEVAGTTAKRILKITSCWMCTTGKRKCRLSVTREFWKEETCKPKQKESKGKAWLRDDSMVLSVTSSFDSITLTCSLGTLPLIAIAVSLPNLLMLLLPSLLAVSLPNLLAVLLSSPLTLPLLILLISLPSLWLLQSLVVLEMIRWRMETVSLNLLLVD